MIEPTGPAQYTAWRDGSLPPVEQLAPTVWVIPVPCPFSVRYTYSYVLTNDAGEFVVVDPGWDDEAARRRLLAGITEAGLDPASLIGIVVTHAHGDHLAMAPGLAAHSDAWVATHRVEAATLERRSAVGRSASLADERAWLQWAGVPADVVDELLELHRSQGWVGAPPTRTFEHDDVIPLAGRDLRVVLTPGHTAGHLCVVDLDNRFVLTGDHVLPKISPNVGVGPHETSRDSIAQYVASLDAMAAWAQFEVLPAHEYRFSGLTARTAQLSQHQVERSEEVRDMVARHPGASPWELASRLSWSRGWRDLNVFHRRAALMETIAHLNHLQSRDHGGLSARR
jgi:glyoxylase-like metal-dependent hydrolase (beta-lactamase superfamily II)